MLITTGRYIILILFVAGGLSVIGQANAGPNSAELNTRLKNAAHLMDAQQYEKAVAAYTTILAEKGKLDRATKIAACEKRGQAYRALRKPKAAIKDYSCALETITPMHGLRDYKGQFYFNRGGAYDALGNLEAAIKDYTECLDYSPNDYRCYNNRAIAYVKTGQYKKAIADASTYLAKYPNRATLYCARGEAELQLKEASAVQDIKRAAKMGSKACRNALSSVTGTVTKQTTSQQTAIEHLPFSWPTDDTGSSILLIAGEDFDEADDVSVNHHTGIDVTAKIGTTKVKAAASGWVALVQTGGTPEGMHELESYSGKGPVPDDRRLLQAHDMGNSIILGHKIKMENGDIAVIYTQYSHLSNNWSNTRRGVGHHAPMAQTKFELLKKVTDKCQRKGPHRWTCDPSQVFVSRGDVVAFAGKTGITTGAHVHFEVKMCHKLHCGSSSNPHWGYSIGDPRHWGYKNPILYLEPYVSWKEHPKVVTAKESGYALRMGPGAHYENGRMLGQYRKINTTSKGDKYWVVAKVELPPKRNFNRCHVWYEVVPYIHASQKPFTYTQGTFGLVSFHDKFDRSSGSYGTGDIGDAWVCQKAVESNNSAPTNPTENGTQQVPKKKFWNKSRINSFLHRYYAGWKIAKLSEDTKRACYGDKVPKKNPSIVKGDFNGDGVRDYAYQITSKGKNYVLAFLSSPTSPASEGDVFPVMENYGWIVPIIRTPKATKVYDHEKSETITLKNDAITMIWCEKAADTFAFIDGKFRRIITGD